ncbi:MAG TPA: WD40 repeat domain-containing protein [Kofleriaceae bacterium]|nr:WD40 repeat domain-containing protein [Kofleriaceae bacterium]
MGLTSTRARAWILLAGLAGLGACGHGGGDIATISTPAGRLWGARFAPSGDVLSVAYGDEDKIGSIDLDSGSLRELTAGGSYLTATAWSPSGDAIYFDGNDGIIRIQNDIASTTMVNQSLATFGIDVSPDGSRLAYGVNGSNARIYDLAAQQETALGRPCQAIRFAPDGNQVACITGGALVTISLASGAETTIIDSGLPAIAGVDWYKDGQTLLFTSTKGIESISLAGERHLIEEAFGAVEVDLSADEGSIVYGVNGADALTLVRL